MKNKDTHCMIIAGGGTGGHFYPAIAIAEAVQERYHTYFPDKTIHFHYIGSTLGIEKDLIKNYDFSYNLFNIKGFARTLTFKTIVQNILFPFRLITAYFKIRRLFTKINPDVVIGTGSYVSGIPGKIAGERQIPLYLQEQNAFPGITTRYLAKHAKAVFYAYEDIKKVMPGDDLPFVHTGNPVRKDLILSDKSEARKYFSLDPVKQTLFVFGGSQGAASINASLLNSVTTMINRWDIQIIWQTGKHNYDSIVSKISSNNSIHITPYINDMAVAYSASDLIISRAGALSLAELEKIGLPAILIPLPSAAANHQYHNAKALEKQGCVKVVLDSHIQTGGLINSIQEIMDNPDILTLMQNNMKNLPKLDSLSLISDKILGDLKTEQ